MSLYLVGAKDGRGDVGPEPVCIGKDRGTAMCLRDFQWCDKKPEEQTDDCPRGLAVVRGKE